MASETPLAFDPHEPPQHPRPVVGSAEAKTRAVVLLTFLTSVGEITYGTLTHSMALVADGWHMATHVGALTLTVVAYWYARSYGTRERFSFGPGKIYALAGFTNAVLLLLAAVWLLVESVVRLLHPVAIDFAQAIPVASLGLAVNVVSALLLQGSDHGHAHGHGHGHAHGHAPHGEHDEGAPPPAVKSALSHDHNMQAAYLHVVADALTSVLAIVALAVGQKTGFLLLDPLMGVVGAVVIARWAVVLLSQASRPLLDMVPERIDLDRLRQVLEEASAGEVVDLHVWEMGSSEVCCVVALAAHKPVDIEMCRRVVLHETAVNHLTIELRPCHVEHAKVVTQGPTPGPAGHGSAADHDHHGHGHRH